MRTTNNAQKTENKNLKKPSNKFLAMALGLTLIGLSGSAGNFTKQLQAGTSVEEPAGLMANQENENKLLLAYVASANSSVKRLHATAAFSIEPACETNLDIENWMTDVAYFSSKELNGQEAVEKPLEIESWILDTQRFGSDVVTEPALEPEGWMMDENFWKPRN